MTEIDTMSNLTDAEAQAEAFRTGKTHHAVIEDHRLRSLPATALPPVLQPARGELSKADIARQKAEATWEAARRLQDANTARSAQADRMRQEIAAGESLLAGSIQDVKAISSLLQDWPSILAQQQPGALANLVNQLHASKFWAEEFLPDWLPRRRAALVDFEAATETWRREQGITAKK